MTTDTNPIAEEAERAGEALRALADGPGTEAAEAIAAAFERAGTSIEAALVRAARTGELSFSSIAEAILRDLSRLASDRFVAGPVESLLAGLTGALPDLNTAKPQTAGAPPVTVHLNLPAGADVSAIRRSETQIAASLARAVRKGAGRI
ncbi:MAG: hypothetical protein CMF74_08310 [Maricaulis sp.]|jgi:hypothetical protein|nr:hypothetical protein [Maricaulis sp.]HAQ35460.1 hypothetical protein [Alphaproteobacteria bacterium]